VNNRGLNDYLYKILNKIGTNALKISEKFHYKKSKLIKRDEVRSLYYLPKGYYLWLNDTGYIDKQIIKKGVFEPASTKIIERIVKKGDVVIDIGANIGYYTVLLSKIVGASGKVIAFEPTQHFLNVLRKNIAANQIENVEICALGLSNKSEKLKIDIGPSSATLHSPVGFDAIIANEKISLTTLDTFVRQRVQEKIDFIKIDIDGHEPFFFEGAWETLERYSPIVIFEVSHLHYLKAGIFAWDFYDILRSKGYKFYNEDNLSEIDTRESFLRQCANFAYSSNVIVSRQKIF